MFLPLVLERSLNVTRVRNKINSAAAAFFFKEHLSEIGLANWQRGGIKESQEIIVGNDLIVSTLYDNGDRFFYIMEADGAIYWGTLDELKGEPEFMELIDELYEHTTLLFIEENL
jgi:hypothetical protein